MKVLIDTCVLSEVQQRKPNPVVVARLTSIPAEDFHLSVITIGEVRKGIERLDVGQRRTGLERWLAQMELLHAARILPVDRDVARVWGTMTAQAAKIGRVIPAADGLIAATAIHCGLHLVTRNTPDFQATGVQLIDPWQP